jgi:hypothetical protein
MDSSIVSGSKDKCILGWDPTTNQSKFPMVENAHNDWVSKLESINKIHNF